MHHHHFQEYRRCRGLYLWAGAYICLLCRKKEEFFKSVRTPAVTSSGWSFLMIQSCVTSYSGYSCDGDTVDSGSEQPTSTSETPIAVAGDGNWIGCPWDSYCTSRKHLTSSWMIICDSCYIDGQRRLHRLN